MYLQSINIDAANCNGNILENSSQTKLCFLDKILILNVPQSEMMQMTVMKEF